LKKYQKESSQSHFTHFLVGFDTDVLFNTPTSLGMGGFIEAVVDIFFNGGLLELEDLLFMGCIGAFLVVELSTGRFAEGFLTKAFIMSLNSYLEIYPSLFLSNYFSKSLYCCSVTLSPSFSLIYCTVSFPLTSVSIKLNAKSIFSSVTTISILVADITNSE
jgi:hypothetical protein